LAYTTLDRPCAVFKRLTLR